MVLALRPLACSQASSMIRANERLKASRPRASFGLPPNRIPNAANYSVSPTNADYLRAAMPLEGKRVAQYFNAAHRRSVTARRGD